MFSEETLKNSYSLSVLNRGVRLLHLLRHELPLNSNSCQTPNSSCKYYFCGQCVLFNKQVGRHELIGRKLSLKTDRLEECKEIFDEAMDC